MTEPLTYQTRVIAAGAAYDCVESYDSIIERLQDVSMRQDLDGEGVGYVRPIELTIPSGPEDGRPARAAVMPTAIAGVLEIPEHLRREVDELPPAGANSDG